MRNEILTMEINNNCTDRTLVYTCADREYAHWIPVYMLSVLMNTDNVDIEIGLEGKLCENDRKCVEKIKEWFGKKSNIVIKEDFFKRSGNLAIVQNKKVWLNTVRFITEPIIKDAKYVYIGDIDIIILDKNFPIQHINHMKETRTNYSNIARKTDPSHLSGLHFSKYESYYPLSEKCKNGSINVSKNDECVLKEIVISKGNKIDYQTTFRPVHGIHCSKNRKYVEGKNNIPGWGADVYKEQWNEFRNSNEFLEIEPLLHPFIKGQIKKLEDYYKNVNISQMKKNVLIVHYNTPLLTEKLIQSVNKHVSDANIYIFENSNKLPLENKWDNVTILDNTKGQIINFDSWLKKYNNRTKSTAAPNNYGSPKHCYSVNTFMNMIKEPFVLLDSDVLVKNDFSELYNKTDCIYCGEVRVPGNKRTRVLPFICYINTPMCIKNNIHYFDENMMHGLFVTPQGDQYDTGSSFYYNTVKFKHEEINFSDYVIHYGAGSWSNSPLDKKDKIPPEDWLNANKRYWSDKKNKNVIYTCITGGYDTLIEPKKIDSDFDYVCFTDNDKLQSNVWEIRPMPKEVECLDNCRKQRFVKINPHIVLPEYNISIWIDGNIEIKDCLSDFIEENIKNEVSIFIPKHPSRKCIYEEALVCKQLKKDNINLIDKQIQTYKKEGMPANLGLPQSGIILRKHNDNSCIKIMESWWNEVKNKSLRDQLSFNYVLWKNKDVKVDYIDFEIYKSKWFHLYKNHIRQGDRITNVNITQQSNYRVAQPWFWRK